MEILWTYYGVTQRKTALLVVLKYRLAKSFSA